jgi:endonuclease YncB( thermonuclease family)
MRGLGDNCRLCTVLALTLGVLAAPAGTFAREELFSCGKAGPEFATVTAIGARDGATLSLADGRELRLVGVVPPGDLDADPEAARRAARALEALVAGKELKLHGQADEKDRYGRVLAQAALADGRWIAAELVSAGKLRVAPEGGSDACIRALLAIEAKARTDKLGLWAEPRFAKRDAAAVDALAAAQGRFVVVEGTVRRVGESGGRLFLDFGPRYTRDFTVVIPRAARAAFDAAKVDLKGLRGKRVLVRGVLYSWGGPAMEVRVPTALEIVEAGRT